MSSVNLQKPKPALDDWLLDINIRAAIAFGIALVALLLTYLAFFK